MTLHWFIFKILALGNIKEVMHYLSTKFCLWNITYSICHLSNKLCKHVCFVLWSDSWTTILFSAWLIPQLFWDFSMVTSFCIVKLLKALVGCAWTYFSRWKPRFRPWWLNPVTLAHECRSLPPGVALKNFVVLYGVMRWLARTCSLPQFAKLFWMLSFFLTGHSFGL